jgi:hypothetical protein
MVRYLPTYYGTYVLMLPFPEVGIVPYHTLLESRKKLTHCKKLTQLFFRRVARYNINLALKISTIYTGKSIFSHNQMKEQELSFPTVCW